MWALRDKEVVRRINMSQGPCLRIGGCAAARVGWEVTIGVTVHDKRSNLKQKGVSNGQLRHEIRARFGMIYYQEGINDSEVGGRDKFKPKRFYKSPRASHMATLGCLRIEKLQSSECCVLIPPLTVDTITATIEGKLAQMQGLYAVRQGGYPAHKGSKIRM